MRLILTGGLLAFVLLSKGQSMYSHDRVYTANQVSNSVSVIDPSTNTLLGEIKLGKSYPDVLNPLYRGQALVHGLRYSPKRKLLAVVSIGSNSVTLISTENNRILKTVYIGRSPHEPVFTPDEKELWVSVRGEAYISIIDVASMKEIKRLPVSDGPGMVAFTKDGKQAYVCSSFTPVLDIVDTRTLQIMKSIPVTSPFSPNIFTSPDGKWIAFTHKDVGKVTVVNTSTATIEKVIQTGAITNHVSFVQFQNKIVMMVTVGGENRVRMYDPGRQFLPTDSLPVGALPHGIWASADGRQVYIGLEYGDQVQRIDMQTRTVTHTIQVGQSPQALVYADNAVTDAAKSTEGLTALHDSTATQVLNMVATGGTANVHGRLVVRTVGLADLVEQSFNGLHPNAGYTLALVRGSATAGASYYPINSFVADGQGKYLGQSTGIINTLNQQLAGSSYEQIVLMENDAQKIVLAIEAVRQ